MKKRVYLFEEGSAEQRQLLGGKGANLAEMTRIGLPVPPGITITTETCLAYYKAGKKLPPGLDEEIRDGIKILEEKLGKKFGDPENPLLVSVRSGAAISMPGMMDTILNLGLNDKPGRWPGSPVTAVLPTTATAGLSKCLAMWLWVHLPRPLKGPGRLKQEVGGRKILNLRRELDDLIKRFKGIYAGQAATSPGSLPAAPEGR